ncbi:MAG: cytochrome c3 family protein [Bdellovibrionaceae bacterium]|nr:cytochrome c3 family protein [Pseudobdellovibrionaceae bacterium]
MNFKGKILKKKLTGAIFIIGSFSVISIFFYLLSNNKISLFYNDGYEPDQPIPFSHKLHSGQYKIDCRYCHAGVDVSRHSSLPSLNVCMNCHRLVKTDSPWIKKITEAYNENKPIAWQKVHLLPDHVKFSHFHHIKAGKDCATCHGPVENMEVVSQYKNLSMGWCVNCHRQSPDDKKLLKDLKKEGHSQAPINCSTCHY